MTWIVKQNKAKGGDGDLKALAQKGFFFFSVSELSFSTENHSTDVKSGKLLIFGGGELFFKALIVWSEDLRLGFD